MRAPLLALLVAPLALTACGPSEGTPGVPAPDLVVHVSGLACERCAAGLASALGGLDGVRDVAVDLNEGDQRARVALADGAAVTEAAVRRAVGDAGFVTRRVDLDPMPPARP